MAKLQYADENQVGRTTQEAIAESLAGSRPGFRLINFSNVALPCYKITLECIVLEKKPVKTIDEFVLKTIDAGLATPNEVASFLGLEKIIAELTLAELQLNDEVNYSGERLSLTAKGKKTLDEAVQIQPQYQTIDVYFDGILRRCEPVNSLALLSASEARKQGLEQVPPYPSKRPEIEELNLQNVKRFVAHALHGGKTRADILALRSIERRYHLFLPALALVFKSLDGTEAQIAFCVDGRLLPEHEDSFAKSRSDFRRRVLKEALEMSEADVLAELPPETRKTVERALPSRAESESLEQEVSAASKQLLEAEQRLQRAKSNEQVQEAEAKKAEAKAKYNSTVGKKKAQTIRHISVYEHRPLLLKALTDSQTFLMVVSPWIRRGAVDQKFLDILKSTLERGVLVLIGYGISKKDDESHEDTVKKLRSLSKKFSNCCLVNCGKTHAKILIQDLSFSVTTSFNWLSFRGERGGGFRDEQGVVISRKSMVLEVLKHNLKILKLPDEIEKRIYDVLPLE